MRLISLISSGRSIQMHFFSSAHGTSSRIDHILGHKSKLSKFKKVEIVSSIFQPQCYEARYQLQEKNARNTNVEIKQHVSKWPIGYWRNQKGNQKISRNKWLWNNDNWKPMGCSKSSPKRKVYSNTVLPQETRKHQIDNLTLYLKQLEKEEPKITKISRRK